MQRIVAGLVSIVSFATAMGVAANADDFQDAACPNATPVGRHLNDLVNATKTLTPELSAAAQAMVAAYQDCLDGYDRDVQGSGGHGGSQYDRTNGNNVHRLYARLALARALERVGTYDVYDKKYAEARDTYGRALALLDQMKTIELQGDAPAGSPDAKLLSEGRDLRPEIAAARAQVPAGDGDTPPAVPLTPPSAPPPQKPT